MKIQAYTKRGLKGGMTIGRKRNSRKKIRSSSTIRGLKPSERRNCKASGTDLTLFIRCPPME
jgi:hypothetical protein